MAVIDGASMTDHAREIAKKIFMLIAEAEAKAHNLPIDEVHFHEVGAVDSIVDIISAAVCFDSLGISEVIVPKLSEGTGTVRCQHGRLPVPVPATLNIVTACGMPLEIMDATGEFVTPTGAAIACALATSHTLPSLFRIERIGLGAGKRAYTERAGILRALLISDDQGEGERDEVLKIETDIDDCSGEVLGYTLEKLMQAENLTYDQVKESVDEIMTGQASPALIASFLTALSIKGETDEEIAGAAESMRSKALPLDSDGDILDIVGTGGDKSGSFNISTTAGIIAAAAGVRIAKHGNRAASSRSGAADCLEALGVNINASKETMERALREENICFMFAQKYHSAMKYVAPVRRELGIRTIFNVLGPLTNPAHATRMVLGVFNADYVDKIAAALNQLGVTDALVVFGEDGLDEISACGETEVAELRHGKVERYTVKPEDFGLTRCTKADLVGGTALENAEITKNILLGKSTPAQRTAAVLNAGAAIYVAIDGLSLKDAMQKAQDVIDDGSAYKKLQAFIRITNEEDDQ